MSGEVIVHPKFRRGDILTLKAAVKCGPGAPPPFVVNHWGHYGMYNSDGQAVLGETQYWLRRIFVGAKDWTPRTDVDVSVGERLRTGETQFAECELCLYEEPKPESTAKGE